MSLIARCCDRFCAALEKCCRRLCPPVYRFFTSKPDEFTTIKAALGFPFGFLIGIGLYNIVVVRMRLAEYLDFALGSFLTLSLAVGYARSIQVRCIAMLAFPTFFGKSGRSYVAAYALVYLFAGPVANIMHNAHEVTRCIGCTAELMANQTKAKWELRLKPIHDIMKDLQQQGLEVANMTARVRREFSPVQKEVEDDSEIDELQKSTDYADDLTENDDSRSKGIEKRHKGRHTKNDGDKLENKYSKKLDYRCEDVYSLGVVMCRKKFAKAEKDCMSSLGALGHVLCWPLKITAMCELVRALPGITGTNCDSMKAVNEGFGGSFKTAEAAAEAMRSNFKVNMQYKVEKKDEPVDTRTGEDVAKDLQHEFGVRQMWFDFALTTLNRLTGFLFLLVFISSYKYHKRYVTNIRHDNIYMSAYFRRIDARGHKKNKRTLLPLKKTEKSVTVVPTKLGLMGPEVKKLVKGSVRLLLRVITCCIIVGVDRLIYEVLDIIRRHSEVDYRQTGSHHIELKIEGRGVMGHLIRSLLRGFSKKHQIENLTSNKKCLPNPSKLQGHFILWILGVYGATWVLMLLQAYGLRLRRVVASFFYPKREKARILFLYNDMLKKRKGYLRHKRHEIRRKIKERRLSEKTSLLASIRNQWPVACWWLRWVGLGRKRCLVCEDPERKNAYHCVTPGCNFIYCRECWVDLRRHCYACSGEYDGSSSESELTDMDE